MMFFYSGSIPNAGHEIIRGAMSNIEEALDNDNLNAARRFWKALQRCENIKVPKMARHQSVCFEC